jgi:AcrR family transcriptional regulator
MVEAAIEAFGETGFARTTIDEITARAGTTHTTFYLHFRSKSDIMHDVMERMDAHFDATYRDLGIIVAGPTFVAVQAWLTEIMNTWTAISGLARPVYEASSIDGAVNAARIDRRDKQTAALGRALRKGAPRLSASDANVYANILMAPLSDYFERYVRGERFNRKQVTDAMSASWMAVIEFCRSRP